MLRLNVAVVLSAGEDFVAIIVSASGELPGLIITALFVERVGRRRIQAIQLGIVSLVFILLIAFRDVSHVRFCVFVYVCAIRALRLYSLLFMSGNCPPCSVAVQSCSRCMRRGLLACVCFCVHVCVLYACECMCVCLQGLQTFLLFLARAAIMASFTTVYLYTPEVYHTNVRITATAIAGSFSRVGAVLSPFVGQGMAV